MNKNFFLALYDTIVSPTPSQKIQLFNTLYKKFLDNQLSVTSLDTIEVFTKPSYSSFCKIVDPKKVPKRKNIGTPQGQIILLHSIAHIEYNAIDLALDACYRFQNMPIQFYKDWLEVANDEIRHFNLVVELLEQYGVKYGDIEVHQGLFDASAKTLDLIPRMALIPRYMEANGLDANLMIINKLKKIPNTQKITDLLQIILDEEIDHVKKGDYWYKWGCSKKENFSCDYFKIVNDIYPNSFNTKKIINKDARIKAGFSEDEISKLISF